LEERSQQFSICYLSWSVIYDYESKRIAEARETDEEYSPEEVKEELGNED